MKVLVSPHNSTGSHLTYHTDPDCRYVTDRHREWDREKAEAWDYGHCDYCSSRSGGADTYRLGKRQKRVLDALEDSDGLTLSELAWELEAPPSKAEDVVSRLEKRGLVDRTDERVRLVEVEQ